MDDGDTLFHANHGNKAASDGAIADATLSAARLAMRSQTGLSGQRISATPRYLLVPPAQETRAEKWLATIAAAKATDVNPFAGSLSLVIEPRQSSATRWYVVADPGEMDGFEYAYRAGSEGPQVESKSGWDVDGVDRRRLRAAETRQRRHRRWRPCCQGRGNNTRTTKRSRVASVSHGIAVIARNIRSVSH